MKEFALGAVGLAIAGSFVVGVLWLIMWGFQSFKVYSAEMTGHAEYAQAESNRRIKVLEAQAALDSAGLNAQAEVARAEGVAKANAIVAGGLGGPEGYLRYLYIHMLEKSPEKQVIYIPTEAGLPILEAGKR